MNFANFVGVKADNLNLGGYLNCRGHHHTRNTLGNTQRQQSCIL